MFSQMSPRERAVYVLLVAAMLCGFGYVGSQQLRARPELKIEPIAEFSTVEQEESAKQVVVHVVGAVNRPGVYTMSGEDRVQDAIRIAGGAKPAASLSEINLAAKLLDGSQLHVPGKGQAESVADSYRGGGSDAYRTRPASASKSGAPAEGGISLNSATASQLDRLPGVGPSTAAKILEYRKAHGGFSSVDELLAVKGIGAKKLAAMRKFVRL